MAAGGQTRQPEMLKTQGQFTNQSRAPTRGSKKPEFKTPSNTTTPIQFEPRTHQMAAQGVSEDMLDDQEEFAHSTTDHMGGEHMEITEGMNQINSGDF